MKQITSKKISFHSARHTYTSLTLENDEIGVNIYDLMNSLGHTSLISTEKYIRGLNYNKINQLNLSLSKSIFDEQS
jgi:integrase